MGSGRLSRNLDAIIVWGDTVNLHAWLVAATGLPPESVWAAYQDGAHEPPPGTDYVTYYEAGGEPETYLAHRFTLPEDLEDPVPENVERTVYGETPKTVTIMVFGNNRASIAIRIKNASELEEAVSALEPAIFQRVIPGSWRIQRLQDESGWNEWIQFDTTIHDIDYTTETVPTIQGSVITGAIGNMPVEVEEP